MRAAATLPLLCACTLACAADLVTTPVQVPLEGVGKLAGLLSVPPGEARKPGLLLAGWLSCDSVASTDRSDGSVLLLDGIARRSGFVFLRVDKPGVGGSDGDCAKTDFETELGGYRAAWAWLSDRPEVDRDRLYVLGLSNGGGFAPLVPGSPAAAGFVSIGGWSRTWLEHMLSFERRRYTLKAEAPAEVTRRMQASAALYAEYLVERRAPAEILARRPGLAIAWDGPTDTQYGRPPAFYQQLQALNLAEAWSRVAVPTLVVHGNQDWIMDREEAELIAASANRGGAHATLVTFERMDHFYKDHDSMAASFRSEGKAEFTPKLVDTVVGWLRKSAGLDQR